MLDSGESLPGGMPKNPDGRIGVIPNREVRRAPLDWEHPKGPDGKYVPLIPFETFDQFSGGDDSEDAKLDYEEIRGMMMPDFSVTDPGNIGVSAYESYTDGTPISPVFPDTPEGRFALLRYCAENASITDESKKLGIAQRKADIGEWAAVLFGNMPIIDFESGRVELLDEQPQK